MTFNYALLINVMSLYIINKNNTNIKGRSGATLYGFDSGSKGLSSNPRSGYFLCYMLATYSVFF